MNYSFKTISKKVMGDLHTPVSIYLKVRDIYPESALLESSDFHGNENSLSFIALRPLASIGINNGECTATFPDETREVTPLTEDYNVPEAMNAFLGRFKVEGADKKVCGLFGYTAFDAVRYFENIPVMEVHHEENDAPDMLYILYKYILVFNHFKNELTLVEMLQEDEASRLEEIETLIENRNFASYNFQTAGPETSPITGEEYKAMVRQGIKHCLRGDVFQIVLSRRFEQPFKGDDFKVYRALRSINPSPYLFYFDFGGFRIFGSSPETHCKVTGGHASIDPIAGTAFRTGNIEVDKQRTEALLADPKENAEHVMLVDLARNDLSQFLSCMDDEADKIKGLMAGGDDYITKPYSLKELAARVYAQIRRNSMKGFVIDHQNQLLQIDNRIIPLAQKEFELFLFLLGNGGRILSAAELYQEVWRTGKADAANTVAVHITRLRHKLEETESVIGRIETVRGEGYRFLPRSEAGIRL